MTHLSLQPKGWGFPMNSKKAHYFDEGELISICRKWMYRGSRTADNGACGPDDCAACTKALVQREKTGNCPECHGPLSTRLDGNGHKTTCNSRS